MKSAPFDEAAIICQHLKIFVSLYCAEIMAYVSVCGEAISAMVAG